MKPDVRRFFNFERGLLGFGIGVRLAELQAFISTILTESFNEALRKLPPEIPPASAIDIVAKVAEHLSRDMVGLEGEVLRKSLQEALLEAAGLGSDPAGPDFEVGLPKFLRKNGTKGFLELFLSRYLFNAVWIRIQDAVQTQIRSLRSQTKAMNDTERLCRSMVKSVLEQAETQGKLDRLHDDKQLAESLLRRLEDSFLPNAEPFPSGAPAGPRIVAARVIRDTFAQQGASGFRVSSGPDQHIFLQAEALGISMKIFESEGTRSLLGQLLHHSVKSWIPVPRFT